MILLTRLDNSRLLVNLDTIKYVEFTPDTLITFVNGDTLIVREPLDVFEKSVLDYRRKTLQTLETLDKSLPA